MDLNFIELIVQGEDYGKRNIIGYNNTGVTMLY